MCVRSPFRRSAVPAKCDSVIKNQFHNKYLAPARRNLYILSRSGIAKREVVLTHLAQIAEGIRIDKQAASSRQQADSRQLGKAVRQMKSVVAQLSAIDVAALYHYHIWTESRYLLGTSATKGTQDKCLSSASASQSLERTARIYTQRRADYTTEFPETEFLRP